MFVLLTLLVLSSLAAAMLLVTQTETWSYSNYQRMLQARYTAEAGVQNTLNWLLYSYTAPTSMSGFDMTKYPVQDSATHNTIILSAMTGVTANYPIASVQTAFSSALKDASLPGMGVPASYEVTAKLLSMQAGLPGGQPMQRWEITSQGNVAGVRNAQVQVVMKIERQGTPIFSYAIFTEGITCASISLAGGANVDSYNSNAGTYSSTHVNSGGNVGSNGNTTIAGNPTVIYGTVSSPLGSTGTCSSGSPDAFTGTLAHTGGVVGLSAAVTYPNPPAINPLPSTTIQNLTTSCGSITGCSGTSGSYTLTPASYGDVTLASGSVMHVTAGTYTLNSLTLSGNSQFIVDSGPVVINVAGQMSASGEITTATTSVINFSGGAISNSTGIPANLQFVYGGSNPIVLSGGTASDTVVYAPNSNVTTTGGADLYGAVIGKTLTDSGGTSIHYDKALQNNLFTVGAYYPTSFSWSKF